jgi:hypothetical protein
MTTEPIPTFGAAGVRDDNLGDVPFGAAALRDLDDDEVLGAVEAINPLDALAAELSQDVETAYETLAVPRRPGIAVRYACDVSYDELVAWRKKAKDTTKPGHLDEIKLATIILANKAVGLAVHGQPVTVDGRELTFADRELRDRFFGGRGPTGAIRHLYGLDGHIDAAAKQVLRLSGFGDELDAVDDDLAELDADPS